MSSFSVLSLLLTCSNNVSLLCLCQCYRLQTEQQVSLPSAAPELHLRPPRSLLFTCLVDSPLLWMVDHGYLISSIFSIYSMCVHLSVSLLLTVIFPEHASTSPVSLPQSVCGLGKVKTINVCELCGAQQSVHGADEKMHRLCHYKAPFHMHTVI